jgi:hypothetical protein
MIESLSLRCLALLFVELLSSPALDFLALRDFFLALNFASDSFFGEEPFCMIVGCLYVHACGGPLGMAWTTQLAPLQLVALGGMLDGVYGPCKHPFILCIVATATALFSFTPPLPPSLPLLPPPPEDFILWSLTLVLATLLVCMVISSLESIRLTQVPKTLSWVIFPLL